MKHRNIAPCAPIKAHGRQKDTNIQLVGYIAISTPARWSFNPII